jgi:peptide/nickel transport system substrate-binding protein
VGVLTNGASETINPGTALNTSDFPRIYNLYDPLFIDTPEGPAPALATDAEPNKDASVWKFKLRKGVTWHDGSPFTADDVVYTINTWANEENYFSGFANNIIDVKKVRKLDPFTVEVPLLRPCAPFLGMTTWYNAYIIKNGTTDFSNPQGTGPFSFVSFQPGKSSVYKAYDHYWKGRPYVDTLTINSSFQEDAARLNALLSGELDLAPGVPAALAKANETSGKVVLGNSPAPGFVSTVLRVNVPPFNDPKVVQAMKLLTDREAIVESAFSGYATVGNDCPGATLKYYASDIKPEYDPEKAKSLLKAAGQENLSLPLYASPLIPGLLETATLWSAQAKEVGVDAPVKQLSTSTFFTTTPPGYESNQRKLYATYWNVMPPEVGGFFLLALGSNAVYQESGWGLSSRSQNNLINEAMAEVNEAKAEEKWHAAQEQQVKEGGYVIPANWNIVDAYSPSIRGVQTTSAIIDSFTYEKAWLES